MIPVQYIISTSQNLPILEHAKIAIESGCRWIQLRIDESNNTDLEKTAQEIKQLCRDNDATFIIENDIELVKAIDGDGVHLTKGQSVIEIRQKIGEGFLIGADAHDAEEIIKLKQQSADYIGCGPFTQDNTDIKDDTSLRITDYDKIFTQIEEKDITLPICAFGDILPRDVDLIMNTGIRGITIRIHEKDVNKDMVQETLQKYIDA